MQQNPQKIVPCLWFSERAEEAMHFYISVFNNANTGLITYYDEIIAQAAGRPVGSVMTVTFRLEGYEFMGLNGGPVFEFTPAVSYLVSCETEAELDGLFEKLSAGGEILMPLQKYPFSAKYAWINDQFGVSWQLNLTSDSKQKITPMLLFVGEQYGRAESAMKRYTELFPQAEIIAVERYGANENGAAGTIKHARFDLCGEEFMAMDSNLAHDFTFTEANSFIINCRDQAEMDHYWDALTQGGEEQPCGWLKDRFGVSWQIVPIAWEEMLKENKPENMRRAMRAMLQMKKLDITILQQAYNQE